MLICKQCGTQILENRFHNTKYCRECAKSKKEASDKASWKRRNQEKRRSTETERRARDRLIKKLDEAHAKEIGLNMEYYQVWKDENTKEYRRWLKDALQGEIWES